MYDPSTGMDTEDPLYQMLFGVQPPQIEKAADDVPNTGDISYGNDVIRHDVTPTGDGGVPTDTPPERYGIPKDPETPKVWDAKSFDLTDPNERDNVNAAWDRARQLLAKGDLSQSDYDSAVSSVFNPAWASSERDYQGDMGDFRTRQYVLEQLGDDTFNEFSPLYDYFAGKYRQDMPGTTPTDQIFSTYYGNGTTSGRSIIDQMTNRYRQQNTGMVNEFFTPNRQFSDITDSYDDGFIDNIINEQRPLAQQQIGFAQKRGSLNDRGVQLAQTRLGNKEKEVRSKLQTTGGGLIEALRGKLGGIGDEARTMASGSTLGSKFSVDPYKSRYTDTLTSGTRDFEGNLRGSLTGDEFSINDLIGGAKSAQGISGAKGSPLLGAIEDNKKKRSMARGLGTQGAF